MYTHFLKYLNVNIEVEFFGLSFCKCWNLEVNYWIELIDFKITFATVFSPFSVNYLIYNSNFIIFLLVFWLLIISFFITFCLCMVSIRVGQPTHGIPCVYSLIQNVDSYVKMLYEYGHEITSLLYIIKI